MALPIRWHAVESISNLGLSILPAKLILPGIFIIGCILSFAMGTSMGTVVALAPIAIKIAQKTNCNMALICGAVVGGLVALMKKMGGVDWLLYHLTKGVRTKRGAEFSIAVLVSLIDIATTNNTVSIIAAGMGMALAAFQCQDLSSDKQMGFLEQASNVIATARPTTENRMKLITEKCLSVAKEDLVNGESVDEAITMNTIDSLNRRYFIMDKVAKNLIDKIPQGGTVLTQCYGETIIGMLLRESIEQKHPIKFVCAETRPYLQGARLIASCCAEMGFETTVVSDNMIAFMIANHKVDVFTSAADIIAQDGHIANKVVTYQIAILAKYFGIPYFVTGIPYVDKKDKSSIKIEMRDSNQVLTCNGIRHTLDGVQSIYLAFDITPPSLIGAVVADKGCFSPYDLEHYFNNDYENKFY